MFFYIIEIFVFRGELTDISAKKEALNGIPASIMVANVLFQLSLSASVFKIKLNIFLVALM